MRKVLSIILLLTLLFGCNNRKKIEKVELSQKSNTLKIKDSAKIELSINSILKKLDSIELPFSSKEISSKVKYYENFGGFFIDTLFTQIGLSKLLDQVDNKNPKLGIVSEIYDINFEYHKSHITRNDDIIYAYGNYNDYNYNISSQILFPVFKKELEKVNLIGSYSQFFGENGIPGVFFTLTSFDKTGNQIDYLIIFNRFTWENGLEIDFEMKKDYSIQLVRKEIKYFDGDLENELNPPKVTVKLENYILNEEGLFEKVEK